MKEKAANMRERAPRTESCSDRDTTPRKPNLSLLSEAASPGSTGAPDVDTPKAIDPSPTNFRKVFLEGIPKQMGSFPVKQQHQQHKTPFPTDDSSLESLLSSLDGAEELSLDESYYFTPLEESPASRMDRIARELSIRKELLHYLCQGQSAVYQQKLLKQEEAVQAWTWKVAQQKEEERLRRRAERQHQRRLKQQQQQQQEQDKTTNERSNSSSPMSETFARNDSTHSNSNMISDSDQRHPIQPKSLVFRSSSPSEPQSPPRSRDTSPSNSSPPTATITTESSTSYLANWIPSISHWGFEWHHGIPALAGLLLACVVHAALYELILTIILVCLQPWLNYRILRDSEDRILELDPDSYRIEDICYGLVLLVGLILARCSGLIFSFYKPPLSVDHPQATRFHERHLDPHRIDGKWARYIYYTKRGRLVKGFLDVVSFYICFVAVMYFLGRFSLLIDQRSTILAEMPSGNLLQPQQQQHKSQKSTCVTDTHHHDNLLVAAPFSMQHLGNCPADIDETLLPIHASGSDNDSSSSDDSSDSSDDDDSSSDDDDDDDDITTSKQQQKQGGIEWDIPNCKDFHDDDEDEYGNPIIYESGPEDEKYLHQRMSANTYRQFWGYGYRAALFDLHHQLFLNFVCAVVAIYTLRKLFGFSFWGDL